MKRALTMLTMAMAMTSSAQEICDNAIDDDGDGLIDLNDIADCTCAGGGGTTQVESIIPNPSFEVSDCIPATVGAMDCADTWSQATLASSDYFHNDGFMPDWIPQPLPSGGDACVGGYICPDYMEYIGACLLQPMQAGTPYTIDLSIAAFSTIADLTDTITNTFTPVQITLWGLGSCPTWPIPEWDCVEDAGWTPLATVTHDPDSHWQTATMTFTPTFNVQAVMIGSPCEVPADYPSVTTAGLGHLAYFLYDDLVLNESALFTPSLTLARSGGICTGDVVLTASPIDEATGYQWYYEGVALIGRTETELDLTGSTILPGNYQCMATFESGCVVGSYELAPPVFPQPDLSATPLAGCAPLEVSFENLSDPALAANAQWDFGDGATSDMMDDVVHTYLDGGTFDVTLTVTSPEGCTATIDYPDLINVYDAPEAVFTFGPQPTDVFNTFISFVDASSADVIGWEWSFGTEAALGTSSVSSPSLTFPDEEGGTYPVQLIVTNEDGCTATAIDEVVIHPNYAVQVPNAFTPDGDGVNEAWFPVISGEDVERYALSVFDRWGHPVWSSTRPGEAWDGRTGGERVMDGVYVWKLDTRDLVQGVRHQYFGHVTVLH